MHFRPERRKREKKMSSREAAEDRFREELSLVLEHKGPISKSRIQALLGIALDNVYVALAQAPVYFVCYCFTVTQKPRAESGRVHGKCTVAPETKLPLHHRRYMQAVCKKVREGGRVLQRVPALL